MLAIKNNIMSTTAARHLGEAYSALARSVERLSSGLRVVSAKDDAAGMAVRELLRADMAVLEQATRNTQDGISMLQTMEAAMAVIDKNLIRMKQLAEQAATGSYSDAQRQIMNNEFEEMAAEIERVAINTKFNGIAMLNTGVGSVSIHVGTEDTINIDKVDMTKSGLGIETGTGGRLIETDWRYGATSTVGTWLNVNTSSAASLTITFTEGTEDPPATVAVALTLPASATLSIADLASSINAAVAGTSGTADDSITATVFYDYDHGVYRLRVTDTDTGSGGTATWSGGAVTLAGITVTGSGGWGTATDAPALNILTAEAATTALETIGSAIEAKESARAAFGYKMNRLESTVQILEIQIENLQSAESRISDVDVAGEMARLTSTQVLSQAGVAMLAQANAMPQMALTLLR